MQAQKIKALMDQVRMAQNPLLALNQLITKNPELQNILSLIHQSGSSPEQFFYALAREKGINPQDILNILK